MIRFTTKKTTTLQFVREFALVWCIFATAVDCAVPYRRNITDVQRLNKCVYRNIDYEAGTFVKTGEPCLNCTCNDGIIVCHLRICSPVPNPPPQGCFILHKKDLCCSELVCNEDNNIVFDGLEARSRPGANDETELELENFAKTQHDKGCLINGTMYAEGSALTSSTDCEYCFCMKGKEHCVKPNCILKLTGCTPVFKKHACCPVKYNCHGSDNVTIISTELAFTHAAFDTKISTTTPAANEELLNIGDENRNDHRQTQPTRDLFTTRQFDQTNYAEQSQTTPAISERKYASTSGNGNLVASYSTIVTSFPATTTVISEPTTIAASAETSPPPPPPYITTTHENFVVESENPTMTETITEISTSISLIATELTLLNGNADEIGRNLTSFSNTNTTALLEERKNFSADAIDARNFTKSTVAYDRTLKSNFTSESSSSTVTAKTIPLEIEALLNITKKKQEGDYELDYDEPRLPPSLPNLKIIPFVAADALDKPKDVIIEHREDTAPATDSIDPILDASAPPSGQFSPPVKTEGGFVPRDPTLDGPFFESKYNGIYQSPTDENAKIHSEPQITLPSITEPPKIVENALCTNGYVTYQHGELISEPKACNMCLCLYGEIVCQEPVCPTLQPNCRRIKYNEDVSNCCGEIICEESISSSSTTPAFDSTNVVVSYESNVSNSTPLSRQNSDANQMVTESSPTPTLPLINPTYMTIKVKGKNQTTEQKTTFVSHTSPLARVTATTTKGDAAITSSPMKLIETKSTEIKIQAASDKSTATISTTEKTDNDYDGGFSFENMLSFLFDEPPTLTKSKNLTANISTLSTQSSNILRTSPEPITLTSPATTPRHNSTTTDNELLDKVDAAVISSNFIVATTATTMHPTTNIRTTEEADSIIYVIKNDNAQSKTVSNNFDEPNNSVKRVNAYYVPPLGNFDEVILNPTNKPFMTNKKPAKGASSSLSTTFRPRHTTAKVIPLMVRPSAEKLPVIAADPVAASGLLKLSGCNIFGKMYRVGKIISELSGPCLQCMCVEVGVQCVPLKC